MKYPFLRSLSISTVADAAGYARKLIAHNLHYHWDSEPKDLVFEGPNAPSRDDIRQMQRLDKELWGVVNPWELLELDPELADEYLDWRRW